MGHKAAPIEHYLDQVLRRAEPRIVPRYVESAMCDQFVFVCLRPSTTLSLAPSVNAHCYVKEENLTAFADY
jgi:hypothetical protein